MSELETVNVGIFGHIDHGKTTLLEKLSGKWADTHSEELKRGITIKLGYADAIISKDKDGYNVENKGKKIRHISFIDAPGHEMLMATTLSGAALIDTAILVVAANEGIKPQTREHFMVLQSRGIKNIIVVQNKIDLTDAEHAKKNHSEILKLLGDKYKDSPIIPISAQQGVNINLLLELISEMEIPARDLKSKPLFAIARSFDINRPGLKPKDLHGAVLGGTLKRGTLKAGEEIEIKPGRKMKDGAGIKFVPLKTKILSLFKGSEKVEELTPGGSMSIETELDMAIGKGDALSGNLVSKIGELPESTTIVKLKYNLFPEVFGIGAHAKVENLKKGDVVMLSINTSITGGNITDISKDSLTISLKVPVIVFKEDDAGIAKNFAGHWRLIGAGKVE